jgi:endonuclease/exonuclease/phosphatase family metal-dependent hydrolase
VAANLTSGGNQAYQVGGPGSRILQGLRPDIVLLQEANVGFNTDAEFSDWVLRTFGQGFYFFRGQGDQIPNAIISRYPIVESGEWDDPGVGNRDHVYARIDLPGDRDMLAVSVHLYSKEENVRAAESADIVQRVVAERNPNDYVVVGGDFNTVSRDEQALSTLGTVVDMNEPFPADSQGNENTNHNRNKPYDGVYMDEDLEAREVPVVVGSQRFPGGLVVDTREIPDIGAIVPAARGDSDAPEMQHNAVVRDVVLGGADR